MIKIVSTDISMLLKRFYKNAELFYVLLKGSCTYNSYIIAMNKELNKRENGKRVEWDECVWKRKKKRRACRDESFVNKNMYRNELDK